MTAGTGRLVLHAAALVILGGLCQVASGICARIVSWVTGIRLLAQAVTTAVHPATTESGK